MGHGPKKYGAYISMPVMNKMVFFVKFPLDEHVFSLSSFQSSNGARSDILFALLLDPHNEELMSLLSRLFPGKSVKDVLESRAAQSARLALQNATVTAAPIKLKSLREQEEAYVSEFDDHLGVFPVCP